MRRFPGLPVDYTVTNAGVTRFAPHALRQVGVQRLWQRRLPFNVIPRPDMNPVSPLPDLHPTAGETNCADYDFCWPLGLPGLVPATLLIGPHIDRGAGRADDVVLEQPTLFHVIQRTAGDVASKWHYHTHCRYRWTLT